MIQEHPTRKDALNPSALVLDYAAIESLDEFKEAIGQATVIIALDTASEEAHIVLGAETLRAVGERVIPPQKLAFIRFAVDYRTDQVEHLIASVEILKGYSEWMSGGARE